MMELFILMALFVFLGAATRGVWPLSEKAWRLKNEIPYNSIADRQTATDTVSN